MADGQNGTVIPSTLISISLDHHECKELQFEVRVVVDQKNPATLGTGLGEFPPVWDASLLLFRRCFFTN